jgi:hypothetical protein
VLVGSQRPYRTPAEPAKADDEHGEHPHDRQP